MTTLAECLTGMMNILEWMMKKGEEWQNKEKNRLAAKLYNQRKTVLVLLLELYDSIKPDDSEEKEMKVFSKARNP